MCLTDAVLYYLKFYALRQVPYCPFDISRKDVACLAFYLKCFFFFLFFFFCLSVCLFVFI